MSSSSRTRGIIAPFYKTSGGAKGGGGNENTPCMSALLYSSTHLSISSVSSFYSLRSFSFLSANAVSRMLKSSSSSSSSSFSSNKKNKRCLSTEREAVCETAIFPSPSLSQSLSYKNICAKNNELQSPYSSSLDNNSLPFSSFGVSSSSCLSVSPFLFSARRGYKTTSLLPSSLFFVTDNHLCKHLHSSPSPLLSVALNNFFFFSSSRLSSLYSVSNFSSSSRPPAASSSSSSSSVSSSFSAKIKQFAKVCLIKCKDGTIAMLKACGRVLWQFIRNPAIAKDWYEYCKDACVHTWIWTKTGFKLFWANLRVSHQLLRKKIMGHPLRLAEHKLLVRTTTDALKLIPFLLFIIIPFAEFALPICLRIFPNMLPSTFFEKQYDTPYLQRKLKAKQELAEFFQELVQKRTRQIIEEETDAAMVDKAQTLKAFQEKLMKKDDMDINPFLSLKETLKFAKLFKTEFQLEKMNLKTLGVMCKLFGIEPYGVHSYVVLQLRHHLLQIQREDRDIMWEGVENLTHEELIEACKDRGMRFYELTDEDMREQMRQWLQMSSHKDISLLLLLWSRCITMTHTHMQIKDPSLQSEEKEKQAADIHAQIATEQSAATEGVHTAGDVGEGKEGTEAGDEQTSREARQKLQNAILEEANSKVNELRRQEEELKESIKKLQEEEREKRKMKNENLSGESEATDSANGKKEEKANQKGDEVLEDPYDTTEVEKIRLAREDLMKKSMRMENELKLLRDVSTLQHNLLYKAVTAFSQTGGGSNASKAELSVLAKTFENGLSEVEKLMETAKHAKHENNTDFQFYPSSAKADGDENDSSNLDGNSSSSSSNKANLSNAFQNSGDDKMKMNKNNFSSTSPFASAFSPPFIPEKTPEMRMKSDEGLR